MGRQCTIVWLKLFSTKKKYIYITAVIKNRVEEINCRIDTVKGWIIDLDNQAGDFLKGNRKG